MSKHRMLSHMSSIILSGAALVAAPASAQQGEAAFLSIFGDPRVDAPVVSMVVSDEVTAPSDLATFAVEVRSDAETAEEALRETAATGERVIAALRAQGVGDGEFMPSGVSVVQRRGGRANAVRGHTANFYIRVETRNATRANLMMAAAVQAGSQQADGPVYTIRDNAPLLAPLRAQAYARAFAQAQDYARAAGYTRVRPISLQETSGGTSDDLIRYRYAEMAAEAAAVDAAAGVEEMTAPTPSTDVTIRLRLSISFRLER